MSSKILIVEDENQIARFVELELRHEGYEAVKADNGRTGLELAESGDFDLVLLDIMLPELNGIEVLRRLRKSSDIPVIMLTARDAVMYKVSGLDMGANDYITKPFAIEELLARIRSVLRQHESAKAPADKNEGAPAHSCLECKGVKVDLTSHSVTCNDVPIELTNKEFMLLAMLMENRNAVLSREVILEKVWGYNYIGETNVVDVYVRYLRSKIDNVFGIELISTVRGAGYIIK